MASKKGRILAGIPLGDDCGAPDPTSIQIINAMTYSAVGTASSITLHRASARSDFRSNHGRVKPSSA